MEQIKETKIKKKLTPTLRFEGFKEEWKKMRIGEIAIITTGNTPSTTVTEYYNGRKLFVSPADLNDSRYVYNTKTTLTELGFKQGRKVSKGSVLFVCIGSTIGKVGQATDECLTNQQINSLEALKNFDNNFIYGLLEKNGKKIRLLAGVQAVPQINKTDFSNFKYYLPSLPEQQKIASFLSAIDEKIQLLTRKKELLEEYKKGVMQQLFSGKLRFKDEKGKAFPNWERKSLRDFVLNYKGGAPLSPSDFTKEPGCEVIPKKGITSGGRLIIDIETPTYCKPSFYQAYSKSVINNSYLITTLRDLVPSGPSIGYIVQYNSNNKYILAQGVYAFEIDEGKLNKEWVIQFSNTIEYRKIMQTIMVGSTQVHIRNEEFFKVELNLPSINEQKRIANYLSSIDNKIEIVNRQITQTQTFKKGLLQQMFV
ncbi:MAG: restriction endonuclease subunit S [Ferruginibacter sp.]